MHVLDCTLRDGGYYNRWDFEPATVTEYLKAVADSGIDYVELGFRNFPKSGFLGPFAYTTDIFLNRLSLPKGPVYGVMVDAKTILSAEKSIDEAIDSLFVNANHSKVSLVRIAAHFHEVEYCGGIVKRLQEKGYIVGFNLMQAGGKSNEIIAQMAEIISHWEGLSVLYFADSFGNMDSEEVLRIITLLRQHWTKELGIHTHDNIGSAISNTLTAYKLGVSWLDSTITGMGRGAGNAQTEKLLTLMSQMKEGSHYHPMPIYELVIRTFESMQKHYGWGSNLLYFLGAQNNVHPIYIQTLLSSSHYGSDEIIGAINYLSKIEGTHAYDDTILKSALTFTVPTGDVSGSNDLVAKFADREVLILGGGHTLTRYHDAIISYIDEYNPVVLSVNINNRFEADLIDFYCVSHNAKFLSEQNEYKELKKPVILPKHKFTEAELSEFADNLLYDYGFDTHAQTFSVNDQYCLSKHDLTIAFAIAIAICGQAKQISMVGFDGFEKGDSRQLEMIELINQINEVSDISLRALTPTTYPIEQRSIYAPAD